MRIYVKPNTVALSRAHEKLIENNHSHSITLSYSERYGHYGAIDLYNDVIKAVDILDTAGVELLPKKENK